VTGVVIAGTLAGDTFAANASSVRAFHQAMLVCAALVGTAGIIGALGIVNPTAPEATRKEVDSPSVSPAT
jgi:hypothetical protein